VRALPETLGIHVRRPAHKRIKAKLSDTRSSIHPGEHREKSKTAHPPGNLSGFEFFVKVSFAPAVLSGCLQRYRDKTTHRVRADW